MDVQMPLVSGLSAATFVSIEFPATKIILMSSDDSLPLREICELCGAHAFLPKGSFQQEFMPILRAVFQVP
jgi:DNA-binding NarL/FixJ family response regulator